MLRYALAALAFTVALPAAAQTKPAPTKVAAAGTGAPAAAAPAAPDMSKMTCGQMMAARAPLPMKFAELMNAIADHQEGHAKWVMTVKDKNAKAEHDLVMKMAKDHREMGKTASKMADAMMKAKDMPGVPHDPKAMMDPKMMEGMTKLFTLQRELAALMTKDANDGEQMMNSMKAGMK